MGDWNICQFNHKKIFKYLKFIPEFDGNPAELQRFLSTSENIVNDFYDIKNVNNFLNTYIMNSIINKLTGTAKIVINIQNVHSWLELKQTLTNHFADQRETVPEPRSYSFKAT